MDSCSGKSFLAKQVEEETKVAEEEEGKSGIRMAFPQDEFALSQEKSAAVKVVNRRFATRSVGELPNINVHRRIFRGTSDCLRSASNLHTLDRISEANSKRKASVFDNRVVTARDVAKLVSFVPRQLMSILDADGKLKMTQRTSQAVLMLADISGFTHLSEELCSKGPEGVNELSEIISDFLGALIKILISFGGDVIAFAGDALIISWPLVSQDEEQTRREIARVFQCGLKLANLTRPRLTLHIGIASGKTTFAVLGGVDGFWSCLVFGEPLVRMGDAERHAGSQDVVVAAETFRIVKDFSKGEKIEEIRSDDPSSLGRFDRKRGLIRVHEVFAPDLSSSPERQMQQYLTEEFGQLLKGFMPNPAFEVTLANGRYLNEFRERIAVIFLMIDGFPVDIFDESVDEEALTRDLQDILVELQGILFLHGGLLRQFIIDDKGLVFIGCFGVAGHTHRDDPSRALFCGLKMSQALQHKGYRAFTGLSTGAAFCGTVGSLARREYALVGRDVNLAARLMSLSRKLSFERQDQSSLLIACPNTYEETKGDSKLKFDALKPMKLKGFDQKIIVHEASLVDFESKTPRRNSQTLNDEEGKERDAGDEQSMALIGREEVVSEIVSNVLQPKFSIMRLIFLEGNVGCGKSYLLQLLHRRLNELSLCAVFAQPTRDSSGNPFFVFRRLFWQLLERIPGSHASTFGRKLSTDRRFVDQARKSMLLDLMNKMAEDHFDSEDFLRFREEIEHPLLEGIDEGAKVDAPKLKRVNSFIPRIDSFKKKKTEIKRTRRMSESQASPSNYSNSNSNSNSNSSSEESLGLSRLRSRTMADVLTERQETRLRNLYAEVAAKALIYNVLQVNWTIQTKDELRTVDEELSAMQQFVKADLALVCKVMSSLLEHYGNKGIPVILLVDDAELMDSLSAQAIGVTMRASTKTQIMSIFTLKSHQKLKECNKLLSISHSARKIELNNFSEAECKAFIKSLKFKMPLDDAAVRFVVEQSGGNPRLCKELAQSLSEASDPSKLQGASEVQLQKIIQHAINARFDRLPDTHRVILKTAAVIGKEFEFECLRFIVPRSISRRGRETLLEILSELIDSEWLETVDSSEEEMRLRFRTPHSHKVCYQLHTSRSIKLLHLAVAQFYEMNFEDDDLHPFFSKLAYHYRKAHRDHNALKFLEKGLRVMLDKGALPEAYNLIGYAFSLRLSKAEKFEALEKMQGVLEEFKSNVQANDGTESSFLVNDVESISAAKASLQCFNIRAMLEKIELERKKIKASSATFAKVTPNESHASTVLSLYEDSKLEAEGAHQEHQHQHSSQEDALNAAPSKHCSIL